MTPTTMIQSTGRSNSDRLAEVTDLEYILIGDLRDLLEGSLDATDCHWVSAILDALLQSLRDERAIKADGGYLFEVLEVKPNWSVHVERLNAETQTLYETLIELRRRIGQQRQGGFDAVIEQLRKELREWVVAFTARERHEARLLQSAFLVDIGGGD